MQDSLSLHALQKLDINNCNNLSDVGLLHLQSLRALQKMDIHNCRKITGDGFANSNLMKLKERDISYCTNVSDNRSFPSLEFAYIN